MSDVATDGDGDDDEDGDDDCDDDKIAFNDPGDGAEQHVAEAFEKGRSASHPRGRYSNSG